MQYAIEHQGMAFTPSGKIDCTDVQAHNREVETREVEWLKTHPERVMLYVHLPKYVAPNMACGPSTATELDRATVTTWTGLVVGERVYVGPRRAVGFGWHSYRRAVDCRIFGVRYVGWFMESSGDYCRLRKAARQ